jgi:hypothetical protein
MSRAHNRRTSKGWKGDPPTTSQLDYLRPLCNQTDASYVEPRTKLEASNEIKRLKRLVEQGRVVSDEEARRRRPPTENQLQTVAQLAQDKGLSLPEPRTIEEADREIKRLLKAKKPASPYRPASSGSRTKRRAPPPAQTTLGQSPKEIEA